MQDIVEVFVKYCAGHVVVQFVIRLLEAIEYKV